MPQGQDLLTGSVPKKLIRFAFPLFLANLLQALYNVVDMLVVGKIVGKTGLAAISNASMLCFIINSLCIGLTMGGSGLVAQCKGAGILPVMITGDHKITATAIAKQIGIFEEGDLAVTGPELDAMSDEELDSKIRRISVYARVSPENKIRIVDAWQRLGHVVSMTGDGGIDAPAL